MYRGTTPTYIFTLPESVEMIRWTKRHKQEEDNMATLEGVKNATDLTGS